MVNTRKQQILFKLETSERVNASPTGSDAVLVYEPAITGGAETNQRVPAGSSMSRDVVPIGRKTRGLTFQSDFRGSGDTSAPVDAPEWGPMLEASGFEQLTPKALPVSAYSAGDGWHLGEIIRQSGSIRGVVIGLKNGSGTFVHRLAATGTVIVAVLEGTFANATGITGESSGTTGTCGTVADYAGIVYRPTSKKQITLEASGGFSGTDPAAGDTVTIERSGIQVGIAQVVEINGGGTVLEVSLHQGEVADGDTIVASASSSATIDADPVMSKTPSATIRHNLDSWRRDLVGARGDFELAADAGNPFVFSWTWSGDPEPGADALPATTSGLSSIRAPRLFGADGAMVSYAKTVNVPNGDTAVPAIRLGTKSVTFSAGNSITPDIDANSEGGSRGSNVSDRDATLGVTVNKVNGGFNWEQLRDDAQTVHVAAVCGLVAGNHVGLVIPNGQVLEVADGDSDGIGTDELQIKPCRVLEAGDDEVYLFQL